MSRANLISDPTADQVVAVLGYESGKAFSEWKDGAAHARRTCFRKDLK